VLARLDLSLTFSALDRTLALSFQAPPPQQWVQPHSAGTRVHSREYPYCSPFSVSTADLVGRTTLSNLSPLHPLLREGNDRVVHL
jgi:hypothetical protein